MVHEYMIGGHDGAAEGRDENDIDVQLVSRCLNGYAFVNAFLCQFGVDELGSDSGSESSLLVAQDASKSLTRSDCDYL